MVFLWVGLYAGVKSVSRVYRLKKVYAVVHDIIIYDVAIFYFGVYDIPAPYTQDSTIFSIS